MTDCSYIQSLKIKGYRGFSEGKIISFASPNGEPGSGLTVVVGANNSGKTTIIESLMAVSQKQSPTFSEGKRNKGAENRVRLELTDSEGGEVIVETVESGGSETQKTGTTKPGTSDIFVLKSRRIFSPFFGKNSLDRGQHINSHQNLESNRSAQQGLEGRIFAINKDPVKRANFTSEIAKIIDPPPDWTIEQSDQGQYYLKYMDSGFSHNSDGVGEGIISLLFIVDALYDSKPGDLIVIDEPELSLHPQLQNRIRDYLLEKSRDRQIAISTHSPKFIDWAAIAKGAEIIRIVKESGQSSVYSLSRPTRNKISALLSDLNNPHILGTDANEIFFLYDSIVLLEGQEDVMYLPKALESLEKRLNAEIYGWGVGGADKMEIIASILKDLGYKKVAGLLDNDKSSSIPNLQRQFPEYKFVAQPADDIRNNPRRQKKGKTTLLLKKNIDVDPRFVDEMKSTIDELNYYFDN